MTFIVLSIHLYSLNIYKQHFLKLYSHCKGTPCPGKVKLLKKKLWQNSISELVILPLDTVPTSLTRPVLRPRVIHLDIAKEKFIRTQTGDWFLYLEGDMKKDKIKFDKIAMLDRLLFVLNINC